MSNIVTSGKVIGYLPGWNKPPLASDLANAGYTHIIVAFGVFDLTVAGNIYPAFSEISADYIQSLKNVGIKVLLSIGGASSSIENTTVDFHQVVKLAPDFTTFKNNFIASFKNLVALYGFDGIDIDIEQGFNNPSEPLNTGTTFENPVGDIRIVADIINQLHKETPNLLISLAPQVANIAPSSAFNNTWASYSSLIMQTFSSISWVGIQLYNTGGMWGIDQNLYAPSVNNSTVASSPDFSVAMAVDLLENWPSQVNGRATGWLKYVSNLKPEQIVLGYPAPDSKGISDGAPSAPPSVINRAVTCLRTATKGPNSCDNYTPPKAYPTFGGVFTWEISRDADNNFAFAKGVSPVVKNIVPLPPVSPVPTRKLNIKITNNGTGNFTFKANAAISLEK